MQHAAAPAFGHTLHLRQHVADAAGEDQLAPADGLAFVQRDAEAIAFALGLARQADVQLHRWIGHDLCHRFAQQLRRRLAVMADQAVGLVGEAVARTAAIDHQHALAGASQHQGRRQAGKAAANDDDVVDFSEGTFMAARLQ